MRRRPRAAAAVAGVAGFLAACLVLHGGLLSSDQFGDVRLYELYASRIVHGEVPYRNFFFEYPPGTLAAIVAPAISLAHYTLLFKILMALCGAATVPFVVWLLRADGSGGRRTALALGALVLAPIALGPVVLDEYDLWPTLVTVAALAALVAGRGRLGTGLLGFAAATKVFPVAILPAALVWIYRRSGRDAARAALVAFVAAAVATYAVFVVLGPGGVWYSTLVQARRGLQKESLGSAVLLALDQLGLYKARIVEGNADWTELTGPAGNTLAMLGTLCEVAVAFGVAALLARRRADVRTLLVAAASAVAGFVAFGKVFSPQYLIWLVPLVALAGGLLEIGLLAIALVLTQLWFLDVVTPFDLSAQVWIFVVRDACVLLLFAALLRRLVRAEPAALSQALRTAPREARSVRAGPR